MTKQTGENIVEGQTLVKCPLCKKELATWGKNYFTHCGKRHDVTENLAADSKEEEDTLTADELEDNETLVRCSKCGDFLITTEEKEFYHCGVKQLIKDNLGEFEDLDEKVETPEGDEEESEKPEITSTSTRTVLSNGKGARKKSKNKKTDKAKEAGNEEEESDEGGDEDVDEDTPDKEVEFWKCIECDEWYSDEGDSNAVCPTCGCVYGILLTDEEVELIE